VLIQKLFVMLPFGVKPGVNPGVNLGVLPGCYEGRNCKTMNRAAGTLFDWLRQVKKYFYTTSQLLKNLAKTVAGKRIEQDWLQG